MVRLARGGEGRTQQEQHLFQSHLGSISTPFPPRECTFSCEFQSHLGSISTILTDLFNANDRGFNPTLVRLAPDRVQQGELPSHPFQSHLGSISTPRATDHRGKDPWFQSHLGSISTRRALHIGRDLRVFQSHLGSISTQHPASDEKRLIPFQSHLGSIST